MTNAERVRAAIAANPGITRYRIHALLRMPLDDVAAAVRELIDEEEIVPDGSQDTGRYIAAADTLA